MRASQQVEGTDLIGYDLCFHEDIVAGAFTENLMGGLA